LFDGKILHCCKLTGWALFAMISFETVLDKEWSVAQALEDTVGETGVPHIPKSRHSVFVLDWLHLPKFLKLRI